MGFIKWAIILAIGIFIGMSFASATLNDDIISYYKLDETTGVVVDELGSNEGTNDGATRGVTGKIDNAFEFDGVNDYVDLGDDISLELTTWTFSVWFKKASNGVTGVLISKRDTAGDPHSDNYRLRSQTDNKIYGLFEATDGTNVEVNTITAITDTDWHHIVWTFNNSDKTNRLYLDGVLEDDDTEILSPETSDAKNAYIGGDKWNNIQYFDGDIDEVGIWDRALTSGEVTDLYNSGAGITYPFDGGVFINSPADDYVSPSTSVEFNATAIANDGETLENMTLYHNASGSWTAIETTSVTGTTNTTNWTDTFSDGDDFIWGVQGCDTSTCFFSGNRSLSIDATPVEILIDYPTNGSLLANIQETGFNQTINVTITDDNLDTCWYEYNNVNTTFGTGGSCDDFNLTTANLGTLPWHNVTIWANDSAGNTNSNYTSWEYEVFVTNQTWNAETSEGAVEPFTLNTTLGTGLTFNSATLTYNGTNYAGTITNTGGTDYYIDTEIDISNVDAEEEREFYWNLALSNGESYNTSTQTQNVTALFIDDCSSYSTLILNYTLYDEDTQELFSPTDDNATIEVDIDVSPIGSTTPIIEYSNTFETNTATICMDNLATNYRLDVTTKYSAFDHVVEYHHIQNYQLNSSSEQHISLYDLATTESQEFLVVFKDENFVLVQDALIDVSREYVGEGVFKSVEVAKTDSQGQTIIHLVLGDVRYDIVVKKEGEILATFDNVVAVCQDAGSGECTLNLNQLATQVQPLDYENLGNLAYYWTLDRADRTIQVDFTSTDSLVVKVDLNVTKFDNYFNESVCEETLTSTTGTITCNIPANFGNVSFLAELYSDGEFIGQTLFSLSPQALESFGYAGVIMVIIMFMVLPLMFVSSPVGMVFGGIIAIVMMGLLSMFDYGGTLLGSGSMIMWFIVAGLILVWRMSKGGKSQ